MKKLSCLLFVCVALGCAKGSLDIIDENNNIVGQCSARFYWHWHGAQDSVDYLLHVCAKEQVGKGYEISDKSILDGDYALPSPPQGVSWNKIVARQEFNSGNISEREYGHILAAIEYEYWQAKGRAAQQFETGVIDKAGYDQMLLEAEAQFRGK